MPNLHHSRQALLAGSLLGLALNSWAWRVDVSCDVSDVPADYAFALCQHAPTVYQGQMLVLKGSDLTPGLTLATLYLKTTEWKGRDRGGYVERRVPIRMRESYRDASGKLWNARVVGADGRFSMMAYLPDAAALAPTVLQAGQQALHIELVGAQRIIKGVPGPHDKVEIAATIDLRPGPPQKTVQQELFTCEGPDPQRARLEQNPAAPDPQRSATCFAAALFSFVGGPYHQVDPGGGGFGVSRLVLRPPGESNTARWQGIQNLSSNAPNPRPDQILRFAWGQWRLPSSAQLAGAGLWQLSVLGRNNVPRDVGLIEIAPPPKVAPTPVVRQQYPLETITRGDTPHFLRPDPQRFYLGGTVHAMVAPAAFNCNKTGRENWCVASQSLTTSAQLASRYCAAYLGSTQLEGSITFATGGANAAHSLSVNVPRNLSPGAYPLRLSCPEVRESRIIGEIGWQPFDASSAQPLQIEAARATPQVMLRPRVALPGGTSAYETRQRQSSCAPCNGEPYNIDISGLLTSDRVALIQWSGAQNWPLAAATPARDLPVTQVPFSVSAGIPEQADTQPHARHRLGVQLKDALGQVYEVAPSDLGSDPKGGFPKNGEWNFFKRCVGLDSSRPARIDRITNPVDLLQGTRVEVGLANFDCDAPLTVRLQVAALGIDHRYSSGTTGPNQTGERAIDLASPESAWLDRVTLPTQAQITLSTPDTGRSASASTTLLPRRAITLLTRPALAGQRIEVQWKGFKANLGADLLLDGRALNSRPLLLEAGQPSVNARLPDGVSGRHTLTLTDAVGTTASTEIEIEGDTTHVEPPKVPTTWCDQPCVRVPASAAQGERITVRFSAFPHNGLVKFTLNGKWLIKQGQYQAGPVDSIDYRIPEGLPDGDYQIVGEHGEGGARVAAHGTVHVAGARQPPSLQAMAVPPPEDKRGWYRLGLDRVHVKGLRWTLGRAFAAQLTGLRPDGQVDPTRSYPLAPPPLDGCVSAGGGMFATTCDVRGGEISQFWPLNANVVPGRYVLELSDGLSQATTQAFEVLPPIGTVTKPIKPVPDPPPPPPPPPPPQPPPPPPPLSNVCNPELPRFWQPGCIDGTPTPPEPPVVKPPRHPEPPPPPPPPVGKTCNPNLPKYQQPGCIEPAPTPRLVVPQRCDPNVPRYAQPNCIP